MRVKKLSSNRRHKAGEDEGVAAAGDSEQRNWVSPTKTTRGAAVSGSNSGASSPTDVQQQQQQQQHLGEHSPLQLETSSSSSDLFVAHRGSGGVAVMPNAVDVVMQEDEADKNPSRNAMTLEIEKTLRALKPHAPEKVLARLPALAKHMEKALYKLAQNEAEYSDLTTLRRRIARIQENSAKRLLTQQQHQSPEQSSNGNGTAFQALKPMTEEQASIVYQHLQSWRQKLVNMYGVAPWDILPNPTLASVALYLPSSEQELAVCGMGGEQVARFGSSLLQELQRLRNPQATKSASRPIKAKQARKRSPGKRGSSETLSGSNKKRKNGEAARLAPAAPAGPALNGIPLLAPAPMLPAVDSLPTLLPTVPMISGGVTASTASSTNGTRLSPALATQQPFFARLQPQQQQESPAQENHMHLLVQGAGQLSKQPNVKSSAAYEQELQSLRWMLHQAHEDKARLESEVHHLRNELQQRK